MNIPNSPLHCISHPLVQHKLTLLRDRRTDSAAFRRLLEEAGALMAYEVTRDVPLQPLRVDTPLEAMLATGHSAVAALDLLAAEQPRTLAFLCLLAAPEGIATVQAAHPGVPIYTAAIDRQLNAQGYILPGLGDAGDRLYGTVQ